VLVGGVGAIVDGVYGTDLNITSGLDRDVDELVALAGTLGFEAPTSIRADRIAVDGKTLRFTDVGPQDLASQGGGPTEPPQSGSGDPTGPEDAQQDDETQQSDGTQQGDETQQGDGTQQGGDTTAVASGGTFIAVSGFTSGAPKAGVGGTPLVGAAPRNGGDGADALTAREVQVLLSSALNVASRARAQIRQPPSSGARVTISVVDTNGTILGIARRPDAPVFGVDVSLQKARTAAFFSRSDAGAQLSAAGMGGYVSQVRAFGLPTALADGIAFSDRAGGNLSRPFYPDGIDGNPPGPFSKPIGLWSPFNVGLQLDLIGGRLTSSGGGCTSIRGLQNGMQIFPGSVPIYRGSQLVGGIGVSGDGVDQDDMIAFLGLHEAGLTLGTINNADPAIRADTLAPRGVRLRYINCPQNPFLGSSEANPCAGK
jgi:uncharacterized protein GlcG (DUF336 family)